MISDFRSSPVPLAARGDRWAGRRKLHAVIAAAIVVVRGKRKGDAPAATLDDESYTKDSFVLFQTEELHALRARYYVEKA